MMDLDVESDDESDAPKSDSVFDQMNKARAAGEEATAYIVMACRVSACMVMAYAVMAAGEGLGRARGISRASSSKKLKEGGAGRSPAPPPTVALEALQANKAGMEKKKTMAHMADATRPS